MVYLNCEIYLSVEEEYLLNDDLECFYMYLEIMLEGMLFICKSYLGVVMIKLCCLFN